MAQDEAKEDLAEINKGRALCQKNLGKAARIMTQASSKTTQNNMQIKMGNVRLGGQDMVAEVATPHLVCQFTCRARVQGRS